MPASLTAVIWIHTAGRRNGQPSDRAAVAELTAPVGGQGPGSWWAQRRRGGRGMRRFLLFVVVSYIAASAVRFLWPSHLADYLALFPEPPPVNSGVVVTALGCWRCFWPPCGCGCGARSGSWPGSAGSWTGSAGGWPRRRSPALRRFRP